MYNERMGMKELEKMFMVPNVRSVDSFVARTLQVKYEREGFFGFRPYRQS
jgi:hypothetical protein